MSQPSQLSGWIPPSGIALILVVGLLSLPEVTQKLRAPIYKTWNLVSDPGTPPGRVVYVKPPPRKPTPSEIKVGLQKLLLGRPAAIAIDGRLLGVSPESAEGPWAIQSWMPEIKNAAPIVVGFPWSELNPSSTYTDPLPVDLPHLVRLNAPLTLPAQDGLEVLFPQKWEGRVSATYLEPAPSLPILEMSLFRRMPQGLVPSLGVESLRRALRLPEGSMPFVEGVGALLGKNLVLPLSMEGKAPLALYRISSLATVSLSAWDMSELSDTLVRGHVIFLASDQDSKVSTYFGEVASMELAATQAANLLGRQTPVALSSARFLSIGAGLVLALLAILSLLWFGKSIGIAMAIGLSILYPALSLVFFLASHWWLSPEFPFLAVWSGILPFLIWPQSSRKKTTKLRSKKTEPPKEAHANSMESLEKPFVETHRPASAKMPTVSTQQASPPPTKKVETELQKPIQPKPEKDLKSQDLPLDASKQNLSVPPMDVASSKDVEFDAHRQLVRLGRYKIMRKMGQGSAGEVYEAVDLQMGRRVAVKTMIQTAQLHFDRAFERFLVEARAAGSLNHPNINSIYDFGSAGSISYMVLEYLDGMTLSQWMKTHPTPSFPVASPWIEQIASALDYAHAHKVIHRDLKPSNLMVVNENQQMKLLDFGVAKFGDVMLTRTGMTVGTPTYMSPEQLQGLKVGPGSDQYTLAVLVYQMLTYRLPYAGQKIPEICNRILKGEFIPIRDVKPELPPGLGLAIQKAFSRNPDDRYPTCLAFHQALQIGMQSSDPDAITQFEPERHD